MKAEAGPHKRKDRRAAGDSWKWKRDLTDEGVLVELLQVRGGSRRSVHDLSSVDVSLGEVFDGDVGPVAVLDRT